MSMITLYFLTMLDNIGTLLFMSGIVCALFSVVFIMISSDIRDEIKKTAETKKSKKFMFISIAFFVVFALTPTTKQVAFIYVAGKISQNKDVQEIPEKAMQLINLKFKEYISDAEKSIKQGR